jgi:hypothetical protein
VGQQTQATIRRAPQDTGAADAPPATANPATAGAEATPDKQFQAYDKMFKDGGKGRWYKIASVGLDPEKQKKLGP